LGVSEIILILFYIKSDSFCEGDNIGFARPSKKWFSWPIPLTDGFSFLY